jgi:hypothetical protein
MQESEPASECLDTSMKHTRIKHLILLALLLIPALAAGAQSTAFSNLTEMLST